MFWFQFELTLWALVFILHLLQSYRFFFLHSVFLIFIHFCLLSFLTRHFLYPWDRGSFQACWACRPCYFYTLVVSIFSFLVLCFCRFDLKGLNCCYRRHYLKSLIVFGLLSPFLAFQLSIKTLYAIQSISLIKYRFLSLFLWLCLLNFKFLLYCFSELLMWISSKNRLMRRYHYFRSLE